MIRIASAIGPEGSTAEQAARMEQLGAQLRWPGPIATVLLHPDFGLDARPEPSPLGPIDSRGD